MDHSIISKVLFLLVILHVGLIASYLEVTLTDVNPIVHNDTKFINFDNINIHRMNKTEHVISGYFEAFVELSNDYEVMLLFYKKAGNAYKKTAFHSGPAKFCDYLMNKSLILDDIEAISNIPKKGVCPWPKGIYETTEPFQIPMNKIPSFFDGDYKAEIRFSQDDEHVLNGYQVYFTVIRI